MKKKYICMLILLIVSGLIAGCGVSEKNDIDTSVLQEFKVENELEEAFTNDFIEQFVELDYNHLYDSKTDKIIVRYIMPSAGSSFEEEQFSIQYYTVKDIQGDDIGYIGACIEEVAWLLWGEFDIGINPMIFSGVKYSDEKMNHIEQNCLYSFAYSTNMQEDEYGDRYYYEKIKAQTVDSINVKAGSEIWDDFFEREKDVDGSNTVHEWQTQQQQLVYETYMETRAYFNGDSVEYGNNIENEIVDENGLPTSECIYCGDIARYTSGAWCCDSCLAVYGEEDIVNEK